MLKKIVLKHAGALLFCARFFGLISASTGCRFFGHQPKEPDDLQEVLKKVNK